MTIQNNNPALDCKQDNIAETNLIDTFIKSNLWYEIMYRWFFLSIAIIITYSVIYHSTGFSIIDYFRSSLKNTIAILNTALPVTAFIFLIALIFKDMEFRNGGSWSQNNRTGKTGALIRKLNYDFLLWISSLSYSFLLITLMTLFNVIRKSGAGSFSDLFKVLILCIIFFLVSAAGAYLYVFSKKEGATIFGVSIKNPKTIPIKYFAFALAAFIYFYFSL